MIRLPDSVDDWRIQIHHSGRHFLNNMRTNETRWLWQKLELNGRMFVRNIMEPDTRVWEDEMDLATRLSTGMATLEEINRHRQLTQFQPFPNEPPQQTLAFPPPHPSFHSHFVSDFIHAPSQHTPTSHIPARRAPSRNAPPHHEFAHHPEFRAQHLQMGDFVPPPPPQNHHSHPPPQHTPHPFQPYGGGSQTNRGRPPFLTSHSHQTAYPPPPPPPPPPNKFFEPLKAAPLGNGLLIKPPNEPAREGGVLDNLRERQGQLRYARKQEYASPGTGRYWATAPGRPNKKQKNLEQEDRKPRGKSRFAPMHISPKTKWRARPPPPPLIPGVNIVKRRGGTGMLVSKVAKEIHAASVKVADGDKVAALFHRDFRTPGAQGATSPCSVRAQNGEEDFSFEPVVGTCENVEKEYLRLTTAPKPEMVRPPRVLKESLKRIKMYWAQGQRDYDWVCRQLKSVRQDYKVQHVEDAHVIEAYETHTRIALERGDLGEFNTCVAQVQELYKKVGRVERVQDEFTSYRILYNLLVGASEAELGKMLAQFSKSERNRTSTKFALRIQHAVISGNYYNYFRLSLDPPPKTMISYLLVHFHDRMRCRALSAMAATYSLDRTGHVPLAFVLDQLGWRADRDAIEGAESEQVRRLFRATSDKSGFFPLFNPLNILDEPAWVLKALTFLITVGVVLVVNDTNKPPLASIHIDFKATKKSGISMPASSKKLITHAGSEL